MKQENSLDMMHIPIAFEEFLHYNSAMLDEYNDKLYRFYSKPKIKLIKEELIYHNGSPDYSNILMTMDCHENCFIFADYMFQMFSYGIFLYKEENVQNSICIICGDKYKIIADSFEDFIKLYEIDAIELQFE